MGEIGAFWLLVLLSGAVSTSILRHPEDLTETCPDDEFRQHAEHYRHELKDLLEGVDTGAQRRPTEELELLIESGCGDIQDIRDFTGPGDKESALEYSRGYWLGRISEVVEEVEDNIELYRNIIVDYRPIEPDPVSNGSLSYLEAEREINYFAKIGLDKLKKLFSKFAEQLNKDLFQITNSNIKKLEATRVLRNAVFLITASRQSAKVAAGRGENPGLENLQEIIDKAVLDFNNGLLVIYDDISALQNQVLALIEEAEKELRLALSGFHPSFFIDASERLQVIKRAARELLRGLSSYVPQLKERINEFIQALEEIKEKIKQFVQHYIENSSGYQGKKANVTRSPPIFRGPNNEEYRRLESQADRLLQEAINNITRVYNSYVHQKPGTLRLFKEFVFDKSEAYRFLNDSSNKYRTRAYLLKRRLANKALRTTSNFKLYLSTQCTIFIASLRDIFKPDLRIIDEEFKAIIQNVTIILQQYSNDNSGEDDSLNSTLNKIGEFGDAALKKFRDLFSGTQDLSTVYDQIGKALQKLHEQINEEKQRFIENHSQQDIRYYEREIQDIIDQAIEKLRRVVSGQSTLRSIVTAIRRLGDEALKKIKEILRRRYIRAPTDELKNVLLQLQSQVDDLVQKYIDDYEEKRNIDDIEKRFKQHITSALNRLNELLRQVHRRAISDLIDELRRLASEALEEIQNILNAPTGRGTEEIRRIVKNLEKTINQRAQDLIDKLRKQDIEDYKEQIDNLVEIVSARVTAALRNTSDTARNSALDAFRQLAKAVFARVRGFIYSADARNRTQDIISAIRELRTQINDLAKQYIQRQQQQLARGAERRIDVSLEEAFTLLTSVLGRFNNRTGLDSALDSLKQFADKAKQSLATLLKNSTTDDLTDVIERILKQFQEEIDLRIKTIIERRRGKALQELKQRITELIKQATSRLNGSLVNTNSTDLNYIQNQLKQLAETLIGSLQEIIYSQDLSNIFDQVNKAFQIFQEKINRLVQNFISIQRQQVTKDYNTQIENLVKNAIAKLREALIVTNETALRELSEGAEEQAEAARGIVQKIIYSPQTGDKARQLRRTLEDLALRISQLLRRITDQQKQEELKLYQRKLEDLRKLAEKRLQDIVTERSNLNAARSSLRRLFDSIQSTIRSIIYSQEVGRNKLERINQAIQDLKEKISQIIRTYLQDWREQELFRYGREIDELIEREKSELIEESLYRVNQTRLTAIVELLLRLAEKTRGFIQTTLYSSSREDTSAIREAMRSLEEETYRRIREFIDHQRRQNLLELKKRIQDILDGVKSRVYKSLVRGNRTEVGTLFDIIEELARSAIGDLQNTIFSQDSKRKAREINRIISNFLARVNSLVVDFIDKQRHQDFMDYEEQVGAIISKALRFMTEALGRYNQSSFSFLLDTYREQSDSVLAAIQIFIYSDETEDRLKEIEQALDNFQKEIDELFRTFVQSEREKANSELVRQISKIFDEEEERLKKALTLSELLRRAETVLRQIFNRVRQLVRSIVFSDSNRNRDSQLRRALQDYRIEIKQLVLQYIRQQQQQDLKDARDKISNLAKEVTRRLNATLNNGTARSIALTSLSRLVNDSLVTLSNVAGTENADRRARDISSLLGEFEFRANRLVRIFIRNQKELEIRNYEDEIDTYFSNATEKVILFLLNVTRAEISELVYTLRLRIEAFKGTIRIITYSIEESEARAQEIRKQIRQLIETINQLVRQYIDQQRRQTLRDLYQEVENSIKTAERKLREGVTDRDDQKSALKELDELRNRTRSALRELVYSSEEPKGRARQVARILQDLRRGIQVLVRKYIREQEQQDLDEYLGQINYTLEKELLLLNETVGELNPSGLTEGQDEARRQAEAAKAAIIALLKDRPIGSVLELIRQEIQTFERKINQQISSYIEKQKQLVIDNFITQFEELLKKASSQANAALLNFTQSKASSLLSSLKQLTEKALGTLKIIIYSEDLRGVQVRLQQVVSQLQDKINEVTKAFIRVQREASTNDIKRRITEQLENGTTTVKQALLNLTQEELSSFLNDLKKLTEEAIRVIREIIYSDNTTNRYEELCDTYTSLLKRIDQIITSFINNQRQKTLRDLYQEVENSIKTAERKLREGVTDRDDQKSALKELDELRNRTRSALRELVYSSEEPKGRARQVAMILQDLRRGIQFLVRKYIREQEQQDLEKMLLQNIQEYIRKEQEKELYEYQWRIDDVIKNMSNYYYQALGNGSDNFNNIIKPQLNRTLTIIENIINKIKEKTERIIQINKAIQDFEIKLLQIIEEYIRKEQEKELYEYQWRIDDVIKNMRNYYYQAVGNGSENFNNIIKPQLNITLTIIRNIIEKIKKKIERMIQINKAIQDFEKKLLQIIEEYIRKEQEKELYEYQWRIDDVIKNMRNYYYQAVGNGSENFNNIIKPQLNITLTIIRNIIEKIKEKIERMIQINKAIQDFEKKLFQIIEEYIRKKLEKEFYEYQWRIDDVIKNMRNYYYQAVGNGSENFNNIIKPQLNITLTIIRNIIEKIKEKIERMIQINKAIQDFEKKLLQIIEEYIRKEQEKELYEYQWRIDDVIKNMSNYYYQALGNGSENFNNIIKPQLNRTLTIIGNIIQKIKEKIERIIQINKAIQDFEKKLFQIIEEYIRKEQEKELYEYQWRIDDVIKHMRNYYYQALGNGSENFNNIIKPQLNRTLTIIGNIIQKIKEKNERIIQISKAIQDFEKKLLQIIEEYIRKEQEKELYEYQWRIDDVIKNMSNYFYQALGNGSENFNNIIKPQLNRTLTIIGNIIEKIKEKTERIIQINKAIQDFEKKLLQIIEEYIRKEQEKELYEYQWRIDDVIKNMSNYYYQALGNGSENFNNIIKPQLNRTLTIIGNIIQKIKEKNERIIQINKAIQDFEKKLLQIIEEYIRKEQEKELYEYQWRIDDVIKNMSNYFYQALGNGSQNFNNIIKPQLNRTLIIIGNIIEKIKEKTERIIQINKAIQDFEIKLLQIIEEYIRKEQEKELYEYQWRIDDVIKNMSNYYYQALGNGSENFNNIIKPQLNRTLTIIGNIIQKIKEKNERIIQINKAIQDFEKKLLQIIEEYIRKEQEKELYEYQWRIDDVIKNMSNYYYQALGNGSENFNNIIKPQLNRTLTIIGNIIQKIKEKNERIIQINKAIQDFEKKLLQIIEEYIRKEQEKELYEYQWRIDDVIKNMSNYYYQALGNGSENFNNIIKPQLNRTLTIIGNIIEKIKEKIERIIQINKAIQDFEKKLLQIIEEYIRKEQEKDVQAFYQQIDQLILKVNQTLKQSLQNVTRDIFTNFKKLADEAKNSVKQLAASIRERKKRRQELNRILEELKNQLNRLVDQYVQEERKQKLENAELLIDNLIHQAIQKFRSLDVTNIKAAADALNRLTNIARTAVWYIIYSPNVSNRTDEIKKAIQDLTDSINKLIQEYSRDNNNIEIYFNRIEGLIEEGKKVLQEKLSGSVRILKAALRSLQRLSDKVKEMVREIFAFPGGGDKGPQIQRALQRLQNRINKLLEYYLGRDEDDVEFRDINEDVYSNLSADIRQLVESILKYIQSEYDKLVKKKAEVIDKLVDQGYKRYDAERALDRTLRQIKLYIQELKQQALNGQPIDPSKIKDYLNQVSHSFVHQCNAIFVEN